MLFFANELSCLSEPWDGTCKSALETWRRNNNDVPACWMRSTHSVGVVEHVSLAPDRIDHTVIAAFGAVQTLATPRQARVLLPRFTRKIWHLCTEREGADKSETVKLRHPTTSRVLIVKAAAKSRAWMAVVVLSSWPSGSCASEAVWLRLLRCAGGRRRGAGAGGSASTLRGDSFASWRAGKRD